MKNLIEKTLCENICDQECCFVFPTQTAADLWADRATEVTERKAVATERFIAWDSFKSDSIRSRQQDRHSIPSAMRTIFASSIIKENAEKPFLSYLITKEFSREAGSFTDWIAGILPSLALWKRYFERNGTAGGGDLEDQDLLELYNRYKAFLDSYGLFDPAWETPPFEADGKRYFIFFPEILSDYLEYESILKSSEDITVINLPDDTPAEGEILLFSNSREELKNMALYLRNLHEKEGIAWTDMAVNVPDMESYGPYISRELDLLEIPHTVRNATPLSSTNAGSLFSQIMACAADGCSYGSLKELLLNTGLPWKNIRKNRELLAFGRENHCICSFEYNSTSVNVWKESFKDVPVDSSYRKKADILEKYFDMLHDRIMKLARSESFEKLRENYFGFRDCFFDMSLCSQRSDKVLSRCIRELGTLIDLEREFFSGESPESARYKPADAMTFFSEYLSGVKYLEQSSVTGVQILPWKTAACAPFACHVVVDSSQASLSVIFKQLSFLQDAKRRALLKQEDPNLTDRFVKLYQMSSTTASAYFSAAIKTFTGYGQASSSLKEHDLQKDKEGATLLLGNPYGPEKEWLLSEDAENLPEESLFPESMTACGKASFENWLSQQLLREETSSREEAAVTDLPFSENLIISQTALKNFFFCPLNWLYKYGLHLSEEDNVATLMNPFAYGNLNHKIMELYLKKLKAGNMLLDADEQHRLPEEHTVFLKEAIREAIDARKEWDSNYENCFLSRELLTTTINAITEQMLLTIGYFSYVFRGYAVAETEKKYTVKADGKPYACTGKIDCLLKNPENERYTLVDFKTGNAPADIYLPEDDGQNAEAVTGTDGSNAESDSEELLLVQQKLPDFQMPMYSYLIRNSEPHVNLQNACFYVLSGQKMGVHYVFGVDLLTRLQQLSLNTKTECVPPEDFDPVTDKLVECMDYYFGCLKEKRIETDPAVQDFLRCSGCDFRSICRRSLNVTKKDF